MYEAVKAVIDMGRYELTDLLKKVDKLWVGGLLSDEQHEKAVKLARDKHDPARGYAGMDAQIREIRARVEALERAAAGDVQQEEYPGWKQPVGAHDAYYADHKITYTDGKKYICIAPEGVAVTYGPDVLPDMWRLVE